MTDEKSPPTVTARPERVAPDPLERQAQQSQSDERAPQASPRTGPGRKPLFGR